MSLINQMLQDLEKRQGGSESGGQLPQGVHSAKASLPGRRKQWLMALGVLVLLIAATLGFKFRPVETVSPLVVAEVAPPPLPPLVPAPLAPPEVPATSMAVPAASQPMAEPSARVVSTANSKAEARKEARARRAEAAAERRNARKNKEKAANISSGKPSGKVLAVKSAPVDEAQERAESFYRDALAAFNQGRSAETQQAAKRALAEMPGHVGARQLLVRHLMEQRANDQARMELREGLQHQPGQMLWSTLLVRLELERGDVPAARQAVDRALPYAEQQADFQSLAGAVAQRQGKPGDAADFYRAALRIKPADGRSWVGLGMSLEAEGHAPEAKEAFRRALNTDSLSPELQSLAQRKAN